MTTPAQSLTGRLTLARLSVLIGFVIGLVLLTRVVWRLGVRRYGGASASTERRRSEALDVDGDLQPLVGGGADHHPAHRHHVGVVAAPRHRDVVVDR